MVPLVADDQVLRAEERRERPDVGGVPRGKRQGRRYLKPRGQVRLESLVLVAVAAKKPRAAGTSGTQIGVGEGEDVVAPEGLGDQDGPVIAELAS